LLFINKDNPMKLNWGYSIILFFVVFCSLMIGFMIFAFRQTNDLVTDDYYEKGANYTRQMEINSRSAAYQDSIQITEVKQTILARFAKSISGNRDTVQINFYRPSDKNFDYSVKTLVNADSLIIDKKQLHKGHYTVTFNWLIGEKKVQVEKDLFVE